MSGSKYLGAGAMALGATVLLVLAGCAKTPPTTAVTPAAPPVTPAALPVEKDRTKIVVVAIPAGVARLGSPQSEPGRDSDRESMREVTVSAFGLGAKEVTVEQFWAVMNKDRAIGDDERNRPATGVTWFEAMEFCERYSKARGVHTRLPTEDEWEYACRAGSPGPFAVWAAPPALDVAMTDWQNGDRAPVERAAGRSFVFNCGSPERVGSLPPNAWGLYDMHGNVWEWCAEGAAGAGALTELNKRPTRGGSFRSSSMFACRSAQRAREAADGRYDSIGFRIAVDQ